MLVTAASLLTPGCAHPRAPLEIEDRLLCKVAPPEPHVCRPASPDSPLWALRAKWWVLDGCPEDVQLRPGTDAAADVRFTCPESPVPVVVVRGHGHTPSTPTSRDEQDRLDDAAHQAAHGLGKVFSNYGVDFGRLGQGPLARVVPPCATKDRGLKMTISDYRQLDAAVDGLRGWIGANDLDVEIMIYLDPPLPFQPCPPELKAYVGEQGRQCELPAQPPPHACPPLTPDSPLRPLQSKLTVDGCPADVHLRPGQRPEAEILFSCPAARQPTIVLRGHGHFPLRRPPTREALDRFWEDIDRASQHLAHRPRDYAAHPDLPRLEALHPAPPPPCAIRESGFSARLYSYLDVDPAVDGLMKWIRQNDVDGDVVLSIVPNTEKECGEGCEVYRCLPD
jgi:hypothetical protein